MLYAGLTVISGIIDPWVAERFTATPSEGVRTLFFVVNIVVISSIVFSLTVYLVAVQEDAKSELVGALARITELNEGLEGQVVERTRELDAALSQSRAVLDHMANGLCSVDRAGRVRAVNPKLRHLLGLSDGELVGARAHDVLPEALYRLAIRSSEQDRLEQGDVRLDERTLTATASPIHEGGPDSPCVGAVLLVRDVTLEREVDRMKTDFIATVSHELRTPLTSVLGFAKITRSRLEQTLAPALPTEDRKVARALGQVDRNLDIIIAEGERLTALIGDVLDISKMEAGRMEWKMAPLTPHALVERAVQATASLFAGRGVELRTELEQGLPELVGDFDRLLQVLINLISNAAKFTRAGRVTVAARRSEGAVEFSVTDTGDGIPKGARDTVFEKFRQVGDTLTDRPAGTGLGLPISQQIVQAHGGRIRLRSRVGSGSRFWFSLKSPVQEVAPEVQGGARAVETVVHHIGAQVAQSGAHSGAHVLIVDDDASLRELLRQQLEERGYRTSQAEDGYAAIDRIRQERPDIVVLDIMMPGLSGFDVAAILKSDPDTEAIPLLVLTIVEDPERGMRLGVDSYVTKPHQADDLVGEIERLLDGARTSGGRLLMLMDGATPPEQEAQPPSPEEEP